MTADEVAEARASNAGHCPLTTCPTTTSEQPFISSGWISATRRQLRPSFWMGCVTTAARILVGDDAYGSTRWSRPSRSRLRGGFRGANTQKQVLGGTSWETDPPGPLRRLLHYDSAYLPAVHDKDGPGDEAGRGVPATNSTASAISTSKRRRATSVPPRVARRLVGFRAPGR